MEINKREFNDRTIYGYYNGGIWVKHRENGPASIWNDGVKLWYYHGKLHREDGPAIDYSDGHNNEWYYHGTEANDEKEFYSEEFRQVALLNLIQ